ncbi:hypothetical protein [Lewinella sp. LCG006]|uniref:hypothetical protein n=1 Tax=Lewinella sp. LCG006 TaxID=3231911 RepID=UPI0034602B40
MSFWDRIKRWFAGNTAPPVATKTPPSKPPQPATVPIVDQPNDDLPSPGDTPIDTFQLIFSNKDKHTTLMLNSISLSSDMKTLYLIDNGRAIPFDLTVPEGVLVGLLGDQLVVATGTTVPVPQEVPLPTVEGAIEDTEVARTRPVEKTYTFKAGENSQYTVSYNAKNKALSIIGVDDVVIHLEAPEDGSCSEQMFDLDNKKAVRINWVKDELILTNLA